VPSDPSIEDEGSGMERKGSVQVIKHNLKDTEYSENHVTRL